MTSAGLLRDALERGDLGPLIEAYADGAALDAGLPGARVRASGRGAIAARLAEWYGDPGRIVEWSAAAHPDGAWWILMRDLSHRLWPADARGSRGQRARGALRRRRHVERLLGDAGARGRWRTGSQRGAPPSCTGT